MGKQKKEEDYNPSEEEENVYKEETRDDMIDNDELSPEEQGFMKGYDEAANPEYREEEE